MDVKGFEAFLGSQEQSFTAILPAIKHNKHADLLTSLDEHISHLRQKLRSVVEPDLNQATHLTPLTKANSTITTPQKSTCPQDVMKTFGSAVKYAADDSSRKSNQISGGSDKIINRSSLWGSSSSKMTSSSKKSTNNSAPRSLFVDRDIPSNKSPMKPGQVPGGSSKSFQKSTIHSNHSLFVSDDSSAGSPPESPVQKVLASRQKKYDRVSFPTVMSGDLGGLDDSGHRPKSLLERVTSKGGETMTAKERVKADKAIIWDVPDDRNNDNSDVARSAKKRKKA